MISTARFVGNPHIVAPSTRDHSVILPNVKATFPEPLPPYLPRNSSVSSLSTTPVHDPNSSNAGRFSLSLKGMRRELRKSGARAQYLVRDVEAAILTWLHQGGVLFSPDDYEDTYDFPGSPIGNSEAIFEVRRTPLQLVWAINDDAFARYVVHCCARYHEVVSFSTLFSLDLRSFLNNILYRQRCCRTEGHILIASQRHSARSYGCRDPRHTSRHRLRPLITG